VHPWVPASIRLGDPSCWHCLAVWLLGAWLDRMSLLVAVAVPGPADRVGGPFALMLLDQPNT